MVELLRWLVHIDTWALLCVIPHTLVTLFPLDTFPGPTWLKASKAPSLFLHQIPADAPQVMVLSLTMAALLKVLNSLKTCRGLHSTALSSVKYTENPREFYRWFYSWIGCQFNRLLRGKLGVWPSWLNLLLLAEGFRRQLKRLWWWSCRWSPCSWPRWSCWKPRK